MPRQVRQRIILDAVAGTIGDTYRVGRKSEQFLFIVTITGVATVTLEGRQKDGPWRTLATTAVDAEVNFSDYGWYEIRAVSSGMAAGAAQVTWSWA